MLSLALLLKPLFLKPLLLTTEFRKFWPGWVLPGGVLPVGTGPLISRGRDYPGSLRGVGPILLSQVPRDGRFLTGGPVRLVPGRDG